MRYNPPPNWPAPPPGWAPPPDWQPDPLWPPPPPGWQLWIDEPKKNRTPLIIGGVAAAAVAVALIVAVVLIFILGSKPSDEEQIRSVIASLEDAYNNSDLDALNAHLCEADRDDSGEDGFGARNNDDGALDVTVNSIEVNGDTAEVNTTDTYANGDDAEETTATFVRENGEWRACASLGPTSDEDQIREVVAELEDAYNRADWDAFRALFCAEQRTDLFDDDDLDESLAEDGRVETSADSVTVTRDTASAEITYQDESMDEPDTETWDFIREDGEWMICD